MIVVGLFVDASREEIAAVLKRVRIDLIQFHGDESPEDCAGHGRPWIKAVRMQEDTDLHAIRQRYAGASALLLDAYQAGKQGGTGTAFDWSCVPSDLASSIVLAGGLSPGDLEALLETAAHDGWAPIRGIVHAAGVLSFDDLIYLKGPVLAAVSKSHLVTAITVILMTLVFIARLSFKSESFLRRRYWNAVVILLFLLGAYFNFILS